jgi:NAD(P)-dependent dehydrogenase (short-subunit alcohol dehydrogenase family)
MSPSVGGAKAPRQFSFISFWRVALARPDKAVEISRSGNMRLKNKVALITGGTSGIGEATALLFAKEGAKVAITGRNEKRGHAVTAQILEAGGEAIFLRTDVRKADECRRGVEETVSTFNRLDILFNNAGVFYPQTALNCSEEEWDLQIDINLKGTFLMSKFALPGMIERGGGVIINNSSGWGVVGGDSAVAYCASKGGVVLLTKAMAIDHGRQGIRVNCICPGDVDTPMLPEDARMRGQSWDDYLAGSSNRPLGRIGTADEIAKAVLFLASDDSSFMTGAALVVDGGGTAD